jgi:hypothetical protein
MAWGFPESGIFFLLLFVDRLGFILFGGSRPGWGSECPTRMNWNWSAIIEGTQDKLRAFPACVKKNLLKKKKWE